MNDIEFLDEDVSSFYKLIGTNVKRLRKEHKVTQIELALAIGHNSVAHISKAELNILNKHFSTEQLYKISKVLDVDMSEFFI